jgi:hypothetical protein
MPGTPGGDLLAKARQASPERIRFAQSKGARVEATQDGRSFFLVWQPAFQPKGWVVTLHGHGSWAYDELSIWQPYLEERGFGLAALQWWFGKGESMRDYYPPEPMYREIDLLLHRLNAKPGSVLAHGFSRGAANIYALAALDQASRNGFFALTLANAGGAAADFPFNEMASRGGLGPKPFAGVKLATFCGGRDENPERDGCPAMRRAASWVTGLGGDIALAIEDQGAGHGGFHRTPAHVRKALDLFEQALISARP